MDSARHVRTTIRYDGPALAAHEMDVQDLAPALLALAEIVQIANRKFNGDAAQIKILVDADVEQKCFQIVISLVQSYLEQAATLLGSKDVTTAKDIAKLIGIAGSGTVGLFKLYKWLAGHGGAPGGITLKASDVSGTTIINIVGTDNTIVVPNKAAELALDPEVTRRLKTVLKPLEKEGYNDLTFLQGDQHITRFDKLEASSIIESPAIELADKSTPSVSRIRGTVRIKSAQYEGNAKWSFMWNGRAIDAEMADQAEGWVNDFQENRISAPPHTVLDVSMTETVRVDEQGNAISKPVYVVHRIHGVTPPPVQMKLV